MEETEQVVNDREQLERLYVACLALTRCLGGPSGYFPQAGAPATGEFVDAVRAVKRHLGRSDRVFYRME